MFRIDGYKLEKTEYTYTGRPRKHVEKVLLKWVLSLRYQLK